MEKEQFLAIIYAIIGCSVGAISIYLTSFTLLLTVVVCTYFASIQIARIITKKEALLLIGETIPIYILVWLIIYLLLSNI